MKAEDFKDAAIYYCQKKGIDPHGLHPAAFFMGFKPEDPKHEPWRQKTHWELAAAELMDFYLKGNALTENPGYLRPKPESP